jgi:hypothetical protein
MADNDRDPLAERDDVMDDDLNREDIQSGDSDTERERLRSSNDRNEENAPTDPDSAFADVDRDDTIDE